MSVKFNIVVDGHDLKQAAKYSFAAAFFSSVVVATAVLLLPLPADRIDWLLIALPPLVLSLVWVVVGIFAVVLYVGMSLVGNLTGPKP